MQYVDKKLTEVLPTLTAFQHSMSRRAHARFFDNVM